MPEIVERPSPNFERRPRAAQVDMLILHYTGMATAEAALERMCDPAAKVSAHYMIDEDGTTYRLVEEGARAWHAGVAFWRGSRDINSRSVGVELVNPGHDLGYQPFPEAQMAACEGLTAGIVRRHAIPPARVLGHSDVAPQRKRDPGELFDWARLARRGVGLWPEALERRLDKARASAPDATVPVIQALLRSVGYEVETTGEMDTPTRNVVAAFQRHYRPERIDAVVDDETLRRLLWLIEAVA